jgi:hypothetical protein
VAHPARIISRVWGRAPQGNRARLAITLFALLAFTLQSYVTQTHIHGLAHESFAGAAFAAGEDSGQKQKPGKLPANDDPANCPICQEILHTGFYVTPTTTTLLLPTVEASIAPIIIDIKMIVQAYSHSWKSRAPPLA